MRRTTKDWLVLAICLATILSVVTGIAFVCAHATVRPRWVERLSEGLAIAGFLSLLLALAGTVVLLMSKLEPEPPAAVNIGDSEIAVPAMPRTSRMAIASLILACPPLSCFYGLSALVGIVLGLAALHSIHASGGRLRGAGLAIAGTSLSALVMMFILCGLLFVGPD